MKVEAVAVGDGKPPIVAEEDGPAEEEDGGRPPAHPNGPPTA